MMHNIMLIGPCVSIIIPIIIIIVVIIIIISSIMIIIISSIMIIIISSTIIIISSIIITVIMITTTNLLQSPASRYRTWCTGVRTPRPHRAWLPLEMPFAVEEGWLDCWIGYWWLVDSC